MLEELTHFRLVWGRGKLVLRAGALIGVIESNSDVRIFFVRMHST